MKLVLPEKHALDTGNLGIILYSPERQKSKGTSVEMADISTICLSPFESLFHLLFLIALFSGRNNIKLIYHYRFGQVWRYFNLYLQFFELYVAV